MKYKTKKVIDVSDWDGLVIKTYGRSYSFQQQDGCKPRGNFDLTVPDDAYDYSDLTVPEEVNHRKMGVSFKAWLERDPKEPIADGGTSFLDLWWFRNFYPDVQMIANDLHAKGLIEAGDYIIDIDW